MRNVFMPTLVGNKLFISQYMLYPLMLNSAISICAACFVGKVCGPL